MIQRNKSPQEIIKEIERMMITGEVEEEAMIGEEEVKIEGKEVKSEEGEKEVKKEGKRARRDKGGKKVMK